MAIFYAKATIRNHSYINGLHAEACHVSKPIVSARSVYSAHWSIFSQNKLSIAINAKANTLLIAAAYCKYLTNANRKIIAVLADAFWNNQNDLRSSLLPKAVPFRAMMPFVSSRESLSIMYQEIAYRHMTMAAYDRFVIFSEMTI